MDSLYKRGSSLLSLALVHARDTKMKDVLHVSNRSAKVLKGIALDKKKQVLIILAFFAFAWSVSISSIRLRSTTYHQLRHSTLVPQIDSVREACSGHKKSFDHIDSLEELMCSKSAACGVDHDLSLEGCDLYWKKTLQKGHIESLDLPTVGMGDKKLETVEEIIDYLEEAIQSDTRLKLGTHMSMGYYAYMLPLPNNAKSVIQRDGYYTPDGRFVAYRVQGVGGGNTYAYHCDRVLGFHRVLPSSMRLMSTTQLERLLIQSLRKKARGMTTVASQNVAKQTIRKRASGLTKLASNKFSFNETHVLFEMISSAPNAEVESATVSSRSKSPLVQVTDASFWDFVTMKNSWNTGDLDDRDFAKIAMDVVDMQIFDYLVGNDNRRYPSITFLGKDRSFLVYGNNVAAGSGADSPPPIEMPRDYQTPNLYLGALGCKFRHGTIDRLKSLQRREKKLSTQVRDAIASNDHVYLEQYKALAHGWLMATLEHVDLLSNTDLDENVVSVIKHVDECLTTYGYTNVFLHV